MVISPGRNAYVRVGSAETRGDNARNSPVEPIRSGLLHHRRQA
jgi:hypothetical protein